MAGASGEESRSAALLGPRFLTRSIFDADTMKTYRPLFTENFLQKSRQAGVSGSIKNQPDTPGMDWDRHIQLKTEASDGGTHLRRRKASMIQLQSEDYADFMSSALESDWDEEHAIPGSVGEPAEQSDAEVSKDHSEAPSSPDTRNVESPGAYMSAIFASQDSGRPASGLMTRSITHELMTPAPPCAPDGSFQPGGKVRRASSIACLTPSPLSSSSGTVPRAPSTPAVERSPFAAARSRRGSAVADNSLAAGLRPPSSGECLAEQEYAATFMANAHRTRSTIMARRSSEVLAPPRTAEGLPRTLRHGGLGNSSMRSLRAFPMADSVGSDPGPSQDDSEALFLQSRFSEPHHLHVVRSAASESFPMSSRARMAANTSRGAARAPSGSDSGAQDQEGALPTLHRGHTPEASPRENALSRNFPMLMAAASGPRPASVMTSRPPTVPSSPSMRLRDSSVRGSAAGSPKSSRGAPVVPHEAEPEMVSDWLDKIKGMWKPKHKWGSPMKEF